MPSADQNYDDDDEDFFWVDETGCRVNLAYNEAAPFKAFIAPNAVLKFHFSRPFTNKQVEATKKLLQQCTIFMAQSSVGRAALQTFAANQIVFGYEAALATKIPGVVAPTGYDILAKKISIDPAYDAKVLHLLLIQQAARIEACQKLEFYDVTAFSLRAALMLSRAVNAFAKANVALHVEQCLEARREDPQRFVPPKLEQTIREILPAMAAVCEVLRPLVAEPRYFMQSAISSYYSDAEDIAIQDQILLERYRERIPHPEKIGTTEAEEPYLAAYQKFLGNDSVDHDYIIQRLVDFDCDFLEETGINLDDAEYSLLSTAPKVNAALTALTRAIDNEVGSILGKYRTGHDLHAALMVRPRPKAATPSPLSE